MSIEHKSLFQLLLRELPRFSLPGVGTFTREISPARKDASGVLTPPRAVLKLQPGEGAQQQLINYCRDHMGLNRAQAEKLVADLGHYIKEYAKLPGGMEVPGLGKVTRNSRGEVQFVPLPTSDVGAQHFGLEPVTLSKVSPPDAVSTKAVPKERRATPEPAPEKKATAQPAETAPPAKLPKVEPTDQEVRRKAAKAARAQAELEAMEARARRVRKRLLMFLALFGLILLVGTMYLVKPEWFGQQAAAPSPVAPAPADTAAKSPADTNSSKGSGQQAPPAAPAEPRKAVTAWHVVVAESPNHDEADRQATILKRKQFPYARVLPVLPNGNYSVSIQSYSTQAEALRQVRDLKKDYPRARVEKVIE